MAKWQNEVKRCTETTPVPLERRTSRPRGMSMILPTWVSTVAIGLFSGAGLTYGAFDLWSVYDLPLSPPLAGPGVSPGERPFPLVAGGWLNGSAPTWSDLAGKVVVVDVWINWCPVCGEMAPDLVRMQRHFDSDDVVFISLTPDDELVARRFADRQRIGWLTGWGAQETLGRYLGDRFPTLLVIGRDGRVAWNDGTARLQHKAPQAAPVLFEQIKKALAAK